MDLEKNAEGRKQGNNVWKGERNGKTEWERIDLIWIEGVKMESGTKDSRMEKWKEWKNYAWEKKVGNKYMIDSKQKRENMTLPSILKNRTLVRL